LTEPLTEYQRKIFTPTFIISTLREQGLALRKSHGQNLLINRDLAMRILDYGELSRSDSVLEIGPGLGTMTFFLAERVRQVAAVEVDRGFVRCLSSAVEEFGVRNIRLIHRDVLSLRFEDLLDSGLPNKVVSNFPYSVAIKAIITVAEHFPTVESIVGTVQRELAERLTAQPGSEEYSFVSVYLQYLMKTRTLERRIPPSSFFPSPGVESAIVILSRKDEQMGLDRKTFRLVVKAGFSHRRQRLAKNLRALYPAVSAREIEQVVAETLGGSGVRAEEVSVEGFVRLTEALEEYEIR
jgi:16S rRNA (adenine1518-N6/adenine1519-N6)-dimethyltransferase